MTADVIVSRELRSLQDELLVAQKERTAASGSTPAAPSGATSPLSDRPVEDSELSDHLRELANEVTSFFGDTEKMISAHPTQSVASALLVGILIGRLIGRR